MTMKELTDFDEQIGLLRRKHIRLPVRFDVDLDFTINGGLRKHGHHLAGRAKNISEGGICVQVPKLDTKTGDKLLARKIKPRIHFQLKFPLQEINAVGQVVWLKKEYGRDDSLGLQFVNISKEDKDKIVLGIINRIVEQNLKNSK